MGITHREENKRKIQKMLTICRRPISYSVCLRDSVKRFPNETTKVRVKEKREKLHLPRDPGPRMARYYHDTPEYRDRVSLLKEDGPGRYIRNHFKPDWVKKQLKTSPEEDTVVSREWKHKVANELVDRHPSNYPLYGVEKNIKMEGYGYVPDLIVYDRVVITTSSFCIHTLTAYNNFISKQLRKMDYDILDRFPLDPLPYQINFSGLGEVESAALKIEQKKRACVIANINAEESSALFRQFIDFCPENTTIRIELMDPEINLNALKTEENQEISAVLSILRNMR